MKWLLLLLLVACNGETPPPNGTLPDTTIGSDSVPVPDTTNGGDSLPPPIPEPTLTVSVTPQKATIYGFGATLQLAAVVLDETDTPVNVRVVWVSSDTTVMTVDADGLVTGEGFGTATITAVIRR